MNIEDLYWEYYHAGRAYATVSGNSIIGYIRERMKKDIPDLIEKYFDGSNKKFLRWTEEKFINK
jgi:hypothetical protein